MRVLPRRAGVLVVAVLGVAGLGLAHVLEYLALIPDHHERARVLADTGHHYLPFAVSAACFLALVALATAFLAGFGRGAARRTSGHGQESPTDWARLLPIVQVVAFVAVEIGERLAAGSSLSDLGPVLVLGLPLQVLAGIAGGRLLSVVARAGERVGRVLAGWPAADAPRRLHSCWRPVSTAPSVAILPGGPTPARGPPLLVAVA